MSSIDLRTRRWRVINNPELASLAEIIIIAAVASACIIVAYKIFPERPLLFGIFQILGIMIFLFLIVVITASMYRRIQLENQLNKIAVNQFQNLRQGKVELNRPIMAPFSNSSQYG